jgi:hypothetical protein
MTMARRRLVLLGLCFVLWPWMQAVALERAAPCDTQLAPASGPLGYRLRDRDVRCEGLYLSPVSAPSIELISLLQGSLRFDLLPNVQLLVLVPNGVDLPPEERVKVRAVAFPLGKYYRLDGVLSAKGSMSWPVSDVLLPAKLGAGQVGLFGWIGSDFDRVFVPLHVAIAGEPVLPNQTILTVRAAHDLEIIVWRAYSETRLSQDLPAWTTAAKSILAGQPVSIDLPKGPETRLRIDVAAKSRDRDEWASLRIQLVRPARP